jgi:hypothetical protein
MMQLRALSWVPPRCRLLVLEAHDLFVALSIYLLTDAVKRQRCNVYVKWGVHLLGLLACSVHLFCFTDSITNAQDTARDVTNMFMAWMELFLEQ